MTRNYPQFFAITRAFDLDKEELAQEVSQGRTASLRALTDKEWSQLMNQLQAMQDRKAWTPPPGDTQRKKMISIAYQMNWNMSSNRPVRDQGINRVMARLDRWAQDQKFKKPLMQHTVPELNILLSIFEEKVYKSYLEGLNR